jgi:pilus assembly protein FimV
MSSGKNPLMLMMALSIPGAGHALGLGEIHVDSGLNERLAAEIDIVGATPIELAGLRAAVANRETFQRYGADRPGFLSSATFKVSQDSAGRPVLAVRSTESFTEPVVNLLVDLNWGHGELIRQYTLLLDPAGFASALPAPIPSYRLAASNNPASPDVPAAPPAAAPIVETRKQTVARQVDPPTDQSDPKGTEHAARKTTHVKVGAKATLRGVAWRVGERSEPDLQRMMIAIFRANPTAFDGNINRLHRGATLTIPSHAEAAAISKADAMREVHAQMATWHSPARAVAAISSNAVDTPSDVPETQALGRRVQSLEQELSEMKGVLDSERDQLLELRDRSAQAATPTTSSAGSPAALPLAAAPSNVALAQRKRGYSALVPIVAGLGVLSAALAALYIGLRRLVPALKGLRNAAAAAPDETTAADAARMTADAVAADAATADGMADTLHGEIRARVQEREHSRSQDGAQPIASDEPHTREAARAAEDADDATHPLPVILAGRSEMGAGAGSRAFATEPTVDLHVDTVNLRLDPTRLDYNFLDLDMTAQHVQMPSVLNEHPVVKERRTNLADVLKMAIEREPDRHDLRMKLLELYYSAAATNRKAFLETVQKFARDRDYLQPEQWDKIAFMGRQIASDNPLFTEEAAGDEDLANCA